MPLDPIAQGVADVFGSVRGRDAVYTPAEGGETVETKALISHNLEIKDSFGTIIEISLAIQLLRSAVGFPKPGATVETAGYSYRVDRLVAWDEHKVTVSCSHG